MAQGLAKRFYKKAEVGPSEDGKGFRILLDGRGVRSPAGAPLVLPVESLAQAIAEEWEAQEEEIRPLSMGLMQLAATAVDRVAGRRDDVIAEIVRYAETDLTCYRAEGPDELVARQAQAWQPELDWFAEALGVQMEVTCGIMPVAQPEEVYAAVTDFLKPLSHWHLSALHSLTAALGSVVLSLSVLKGRLDGGTAFDHSRLDELYQIELWGEDSEAKEKRQAVRDDVKTAERFFELIDG